MANTSRSAGRVRRHARVRKSVVGSAQRPRLNVYKSLVAIYAQIIDDGAGRTLVSASTVDRDLREQPFDRERGDRHGHEDRGPGFHPNGRV